MSDPTPQSIHGPGGLLATPGLGTPKRRRKWGQRLKAKQIVGNLYRADDGKFSAGGSSPAGAKPQRGIVLSKQPKPTKRAPIKGAAPKKRTGGAAKKPAGPKPKDPEAQARQAQRDQERAADRATRATDRETRLADRQARIARTAARDQERSQRQADAAKKKLEAKPAKASGGGGSKKPKDDKGQARAKKADATAAQVGMAAADLAALRSATEAGGVANAALTALGLLGPDGLATDQGRRALSALERGDVRQYQAALQDAKSRMGREQGARDRKQQAESKRTTAATERSAKQQRQIDRIKRRAMNGGRLTQAQMDQAMEAGALSSDGRWKSFTVYKDHSGAHRWIARTTTAYRDRDGEIISVAALDRDSQRMMASKQFGPLRYWHVGQPDPLSHHAPWGPGLDIGDCDYSVVIGRTRIESGTFRSAAIALKMAAVAHRHEMSPGFFHPLDQPTRDGVFDSIRTFERSPVPTRYGRASNLFTGFTVKEFRMELAEMERRFKAMYQELGLTPEQGMELGQSLIATEKAAAAQGIAFKSADDLPDLEINGVTYKAVPKGLEDVVDDPPIEAKADDMIEAMAEEVVEPEAELAGDFLGDMTWDEFSAKLSDLLAPVLKMQDMVKSIGDAHAELKGMYGGVAQKDAASAQELTALKTAHAELAQKIADIEGNQPATILPDDVAEALKSAGPATPAASEQPQIQSTPERPWKGWGAQTFPELYATEPA